MGTFSPPTELEVKKFLYTCSCHGVFITNNSDKHICKYVTDSYFNWIKSAPEDFFRLLETASSDPLLVKRAGLFYLPAQLLHSPDIPNNLKQQIKSAIFKIIKNDEEFFTFIKYYTLQGKTNKPKIPTTLRKMILKFYQTKEPLEFAKTVAKQESYHSWAHKDLIKLCHFKSDKTACEPVIKYVLFGAKQLPEPNDSETKTIIEFLKKTHELRTVEDVNRAVSLMQELHAPVEQVNSKLNKNEQIWLTALTDMSTRDILKNLYKFYRFGFLKANSQFQAKVIEELGNKEKIQKCNLHPVEVFIYLKQFEKGGKPMDPKLLEYLNKKEIKEETLKKLTTPNEPKCKPVIQNINKCLKLSYDNVEPTGKRFLITIDVTDKAAEEMCFHNKRISFFEAAVTIIRFLTKIEKSVSVAVFKDNQINFIDISKSHSAVDKLREYQANYILPNAPIDYAKSKKKPVDVFINFMSCSWQQLVPAEIRDKTEKIPDALNKYQTKMKLPDSKVVKIFLGGLSSGACDNRRNIFSIAGFSAEVPRLLEAFCRGNFS